MDISARRDKGAIPGYLKHWTYADGLWMKIIYGGLSTIVGAEPICSLEDSVRSTALGQVPETGDSYTSDLLKGVLRRKAVISGKV